MQYRPHIGIIILAAGASRRMGSPKQLLEIKHQTLIERAVEISTSIENAYVVTVLGANAAKIKPFIKAHPSLELIVNQEWQLGMGTSLRKGVQYLIKQKSLDAIIIMVCDQPYLTADILKHLIKRHIETKANIVAAQYGNIKGVPALFSKNVFPALSQLNADEGARKIIKNYKGKVASIDFPKGAIDLDTPAAYQQFLENTIL